MSRLADELEKKIAALEKKRAEFNRDIDEQIGIFRAALKSESPDNGSVSSIEDDEDEGRSSEHPSRMGADSLFILEAISRKPGISAAEVKEAAAKRGLKGGPKFPYKNLSRLNAAGHIKREPDGRYYPVSDE